MSFRSNSSTDSSVLDIASLTSCGFMPSFLAISSTLIPCFFKAYMCGMVSANSSSEITSLSSTKPFDLANSSILCRPSDFCIESKNFSLADFTSPCLALDSISIICFSALASPTEISTCSPSSVLTVDNGFLISSDPSCDISKLSMIFPSWSNIGFSLKPGILE